MPCLIEAVSAGSGSDPEERIRQGHSKAILLASIDTRRVRAVLLLA